MVAPVQPDVRALAEFQQITLALKVMDRGIRSDINKESRTTMNPVWRAAVEANATTRQDTAFLAKGARIAAGNPAVAVAASSTKARSGGLVPADNGYAFEFGAAARREKVSYSRKSKNGGRHTVTRATKAGLPARAPKGRAIYPAFADTAPRMVSMWAQIIYRRVYEAFGDK